MLNIIDLRVQFSKSIKKGRNLGYWLKFGILGTGTSQELLSAKTAILYFCPSFLEKHIIWPIILRKLVT
jgi:hypothetical protein